MSLYTYMIDRRSDELGGGWRLRMLEDGVEVGGGVFPPEWGLHENPLEAAYWDALEEAEGWVVDHQREFSSVLVIREVKMQEMCHGVLDHQT